MLPAQSSANSSSFQVLSAPQAPTIVSLTHEFFPQRGGIAVYIEEMARALASFQRTIEVWAPRHPEIQHEGFPFPVRQMPLKGTQGWPARLQLADFMRRNRARLNESVLWLPEPGPLRACMYLQLLRSLRPKALVITLHGSEISNFASVWHRRKLLSGLLERAHRIGVVSRFSRDLLIDAFPHAADRVVLAPGALRSQVTVPEIAPNGREGRGRVIILTVARVHPRKGQHALIQALAMLPEELRSRTEYWIVGPVRRKAYLQRLQSIARRGHVNLRILGQIPDDKLDDVYAQADIFAMTSIPVRHSVEGFGLTYLEASAHSLPVIAHRTGGVGDAVRNGYTGIKVAPDDRSALANALRKLVVDESLRRQLGANGRLWAQSFSWRDSAQALFNDL